MSRLYTAILRHAKDEAEAGDWADVLTKLNAKSIITRNGKLHVLGDLIRLLGVEQTSLVGGTVQAVGQSNPIIAGAWIALNTTGLHLADDERQVMLDGLAAAGSWPAETTKKVKELGKVETSPLESYGIEDEVTEQSAEDAWNQGLFEEEYDIAKQTVVAAIESGRAATVAALRALADSLEA